MMIVQLTYFKSSGKYYSSGSYSTSKQHLFEVWEEVQVMANSRELPDLIRGHSDFTTLVRVPDHPNDYPQLITPARSFAPQEQTILAPGNHLLTITGSGTKADPKRFHCSNCHKEFGLMLNPTTQECNK